MAPAKLAQRLQAGKSKAREYENSAGKAGVSAAPAGEIRAESGQNGICARRGKGVCEKENRIYVRGGKILEKMSGHGVSCEMSNLRQTGAGS